MKIKKLYLDNYGIFENQLIENIQDNFIVIGGLNRAGKSTFFNIIRQLGYGFKKNDSALCKNTKIKCSGIYNNRKFDLNISGYGKPQVIFKDNLNEISVENIYSNVDYFTYKELFTISLSELYKEVIKDNKEAEKLQTIFLGAGLKDIISLPKITKMLKGEGEKIGGKFGKANTKQFKIYNDRILKALKQKQEAKMHLKDYENYLQELNTINKQITQLLNKKNLEVLKIQKLDFLIENFDLYNEIINRNLELTKLESINILNIYSIEKIEKAKLIIKDYKSILDKINKNQQSININYKYPKENIKILSSSKYTVLEYSNKIYSLENTIDYYFNLKEDSKDVENQIKENLYFLNSNLNDSINWIKETKWDELYKKDLFETINEYNEKSKELLNLKKDLNDLEFKYKLINEDTKIDINKPIKQLRHYMASMVIFIILGFIISFINTSLGIILSFSGLLGSGFIFLGKYISRNNKNVKNNLLEYTNTIYIEIDNKKKEITLIQKRLDHLKLMLEKYKLDLKINKNIYYDNLKDYFSCLYSIKKELVKLDKQKNKEKEIFNKIINTLLETNKFIKNIVNINIIQNEILEGNLYEIHSKFKNIISDILRCNSIAINMLQNKKDKLLLENKLKELFNIKNNINEERFLELADKFLLEFKNYVRIIKMKEEQNIAKDYIIKRLNNENVKSLFTEDIENNMEITGDNIVDIVDNIYNSYISRQQIRNNIENYKLNLDNINYELESLKEKKQDLKTKLEILSTEEITFLAQQDLDKQKYELKLLAKKYATYNCAAFMLFNIQNRFIKNAKNSILSKSSEIFKYITSKDYEEIKVADNLINHDFKTINSKGDVINTSTILSRGTREQLFLSVRMSRINDLGSDLPIIIDDSLVNFDKKHLINTINILKELSKTHQIFFLTCHSYIIDVIKNSVGDKVQYFKLKEGKFSNCDCKTLQMYLNCEN